MHIHNRAHRHKQTRARPVSVHSFSSYLKHRKPFASCTEPQLDTVALFTTLVLPKSIIPAIYLPNTFHVAYSPLSHITVFNYLPLTHIFQKRPKPISSVKPYLQMSPVIFSLNSQSLIIFNTFHTIFWEVLLLLLIRVKILPPET